MATELRKTGISIVGDISWGTHFCCFYETTQDLLDILVPYFKAGWENNEFGLWVISNSEVLTVQEAISALRNAVPDLDRHLAERSIEVVGHDEWFLEAGAFDFSRVVNRFKEKLDEALSRGYVGMRLNGSPAWIELKEEWRAFERELDRLFLDERIIASCTYPLAESGAADLLDVADTHQFSIARRQGNWEVLETPELMQAKQEIQRLNGELEQRVVERTSELAAANQALRREIVERQQAEEALHASQARLQAAIDAADIGLWDWDLVFGQISWLGHHDKLFGFAPGEFDGTYPSFEKRIHAEDLEELNSAVQRAREERSGYAHEYRVVWPDGSIHWIAGRGRFKYNDAGQPVRMYGAVIDITERKQAEQALRQSESDLAEAQRVARLGSWSFDIASNTVRWSDELYRIFDVEKTAFDGVYEAFLSRVHPDDRARVLQVNAEVKSRGKPFEVEYRITTRSSQLKHVREIGYARKDSTGAVSGLFGTAQDITERKQAEEALRISENNFRTLADKSLQGIAIGQGSKIMYANPAHSAIFGYTTEELKSMSLEQLMALVHPDDRAIAGERARKRMAGEEISPSAELRIVRKDGSTRWIQFFNNTIEYDGQPALLSVSIDITERKRAEEAIRKSEQVLREAESLGHTGSWEHNLVTGEIFNTEENLRRFFGDDRSKGKLFEDYAQAVHPDDRELVLRRHAQLLAEGGPRDIEFRVVWPDGSVHVLFGRATVVRDELGQAIRIYGTNVDITERKQAEAAIRSLLQISEKLHATLDIDALLASLVIEAMELIDAEIGWSGLRSSEGMVCHTHITRDLQVVPFEYFLPPSVGLPGWVLVHKVPYVMNDAQADKLIIPEIRERFGVKALIDTPILDAQGEVIGFFEVGNKKNGGGFAESDVEKLVAVSRIASIALQNAMSYRNLERAEKALRESQLHLQRLSRQLLQAQEAERRSIARELHDEIGQQLTALSLILTSEHSSPDQLSDAHAVVRGLIDRLRNLSLDLRPTILDDLGLIPALVWLFERYTAQTTVSVRFEHSGLEEQRFDPEVETTAYRIVQEALTNVARHAGVREVTVRLWTDDDTLSVMIVDAGRGFDPQRINTRASSGLAGMQERAALLGGEMTIESAVGEGTRLTVTLPLQGGTGLGEQEQGP